MKLRHERPQSDLAFQVRAPLRLELARGEVVTIEQWSLAGVEYPGHADIRPLKGVLSIPFQGVDIRFPVTFEGKPGSSLLEFKDLTGRQRETLAVFYRSILSGRMAVTDEIITALDTPVDLVPMGETDEEKVTGTAGKNPRALRILWNIVFYAVFAFVVFGVIGSQIWSRVSTIPMSHARINAPVETLHAPANAFVDKIVVPAGSVVTQGQLLVALSDPEADAEVDDIRKDIARQATRVQEARKRWEKARAERDRRLEVLWADVLRAARTYPATAHLGGWSVPRVKRALIRFYAAQANKKAAAGLAALKKALDLEKDAFARLKRDLSNAKGAASALDVHAPFDGTVSEIRVFEDQSLLRGTEVLVIEKNELRTARAWVDERLAGVLAPGMTANVRFNSGAGSRSLPGTIQELSGGIDPLVPGAYGMLVTVTLDGLTTGQTRRLLRPGLPVKIRADRALDWLPDWLPDWAR